MMVRSISLALYSLLLGASVMAQTPAAGNAAVSAMPAPAASSTSRAIGIAVNPLTGMPLDYEQKQRLIEDTKLQTSLYKEQLEQGKVKIDLTLLPLAERAARLQLAGANAKLDSVDGATKVSTASKVSRARKNSKTSKNLSAEPNVMPQLPPVAMGSGFIEFGDGGTRERVNFGNSRRSPTVALTDMTVAAAAGVNSPRPAAVNNPPLPPQMARSPVPVAPNASLAGTVGAGVPFR